MDYYCELKKIVIRVVAKKTACWPTFSLSWPPENKLLLLIFCNLLKACNQASHFTNRTQKGHANQLLKTSLLGKQRPATKDQSFPAHLQPRGLNELA